VAEFRRELDSDLTEIQREFASADPKIGWSLPEMHPESHALSESNSKKVLWLLNAVPHGVLSMSYDIPDLVETSANLATVRTEKESLHIHVSNRSSVASALTALQKRVASIGRLAGATVEETEGYPGWKPNMNSAILKISAEVYQKLFARDPQVKAVHAGLECGIIGERYPGMDMVSFGPQIEFPHSPDERVKIESVSDFYQHLVAVLEELAVRPPSI
jgi:dipeptidase D